MTSFSWKKKAGSQVKRCVSTAFEEDTKDENEEIEGVDWLTLAPQRKIICLEDAICKSSRLKGEGSLLAESERYWEAIKKWDEALQFTPLDEAIYEMKAQALLALCEVFPAVSMAEKAVKLNPNWWTSYQTLGRAQLGLGEVRQALKSFSKAVHINPSDEELWKDDLLWAFSLLKQKNEQDKVLAQDIENSKVKLTEISNDEVNSFDRLIDDNHEINVSINEKQGTDKHIVRFTNSHHIQQDTSKPTELNNLPQNYVFMRDT